MAVKHTTPKLRRNLMRTHRFWFTALTIFLFSIGVADAGKPVKPPGPSAGPKNVILLIGDGMGPNQVQAARLMAGDELAMDRLDPSSVTVTTHNISGGIPDSASTGTALATGFKTENGNISMAADDETVLPTSMELARDNGMATGIVTNTYVQDATPGVWLAHAPSRDGRSIAAQQAVAGMDVLLGSGRYYMLPKGTRGGSRTDGRNLIDEMVADGYTYVDTLDELNAVRDPRVGLLGIFGSIWTTEYVLDRDDDPQGAPTVVEMAAKAMDVLSGDRNGFFLVVEGAYTDWSGHNRDIGGVVSELLEFDSVVQLALDRFGGDGETLIIATADHETGGLVFVDNDDANLNLDFLSGVTCTTEFMWGLISKGLPIEEVMGNCGIENLDGDELDLIRTCKQDGMGDVLADRAGVDWENGGCDGGNHTLAEVEVYAHGPGAEEFDSITDNTHIGQLLFSAVGP
jgi:alkaline phosphatase